MASALEISLSIGDVCFHLAPSSPSNHEYPPCSSPRTQARTASPYASHKKRLKLRRSGLAVRTPSFPYHQHQQAPASSPIVTIRHGNAHSTSRGSMVNNLSPPSNVPRSPPLSPLQQHVRGRVKAARDRFEPQDYGSNGPAPQAQSPLFSSSESAGGDYCVDLHSFSGTLHISSRREAGQSTKNNSTGDMSSSLGQKSSGQANDSPRPVFKHLDSMPMNNSSFRQKRVQVKDSNSSEQKPFKSLDMNSARPTFKHTGSMRSPRSLGLQSGHKRTVDNANVEGSVKSRRTITWISSNESDEVEVGRVSGTNDDGGLASMNDVVNVGIVANDEQEEGHESGDSVNQNTKNEQQKAVRFSMLSQPSIINTSPERGDSPDNTTNPVSNDSSNNQNAMQDPQPNIVNGTSQAQAQSSQQMQPKSPKNKYFFSSPQKVFSSPPRPARASTKAPIDIARGTSSMLARSSRHVLKQITLAGKDVFDAISGDATSPGNSTNKNNQSMNSGNVHGGSGAFLDPNNGLDDEVYDAVDGTELHYACAANSLDHLRCLLEYENLEDLNKADCEGKLPIHILVENHDLINEDPLGCEEVAFTMIEQMGPKNAVQSLHPSGLAPFVYIIGTWTQSLHHGATARASYNMRSSASKSPVGAIAASNEDIPQGMSSSSSNDNSQSRRRRVTYRSLFNLSTGNDKSLTSSTDRAKLLYLPPTKVTMPDHVLWAVHILSKMLDSYPEQTRESILTNMAAVPLFLKSLLLISNFDEMTALLDKTLVKHVTMDKRSINVWLCAMLTDTKDVKLRAVTFIKLLSRLTLQDLNSASESPDRYSEQEIERFAILREETFNAVYDMPGIVPAVLELGGRTIEHLSTTRVMRYITDRTIRKESVFFVLILDFFYSIFLLLGYRVNVEFVLNYESIDGPEYYREYNTISSATMGVAGYFLVKELMTLLSLYLTSTKLAKRYCSSVFNIIDFAAVAMLLGTEGALTTDPTLLDNEGFAASLTIILLWLKLMGAFKILNSAFSLFLYAVNEVIKEVKWFILFLFGITLMFSDAARTIVAARGDCQYIDGNEYGAEEFCSDQLLAGIIRMYSVLVGDVALEYFQSSDAMVAVFVFFTFFSITILLNILIAIIIDSYEGSKQRSREIFSRARIEYAAHLVARKQFLNPKECSDFHVATYVPQKVRQALRVVYGFVQAIAMLAVEYGFVGAVYFLTLDSKNDYRMIQSLIIVYVVVGAIFNAYVLSVAAIALFSRYDRGFNGLNWLSGNRGNTLYNITKKIVQFLQIIVTLFHGLLGFNADRAVDQGIVDVSEESLITGEL